MNVQELLELRWTTKSSNFSRAEYLNPLDGTRGVVAEEEDDLDKGPVLVLSVGVGRQLESPPPLVYPSEISRMCSIWNLWKNSSKSLQMTCTTSILYRKFFRYVRLWKVLTEFLRAEDPGLLQGSQDIVDHKLDDDLDEELIPVLLRGGREVVESSRLAESNIQEPPFQINILLNQNSVKRIGVELFKQLKNCNPQNRVR